MMRPLLAVILCCIASLSQASSNFAFDPVSGQHGVGLRVVEQYDYARSYRGKYDIVTGKPVAGETARPMQTVIWYPAQKSGKSISYGDYSSLNISVDQFGRSDADIRAATAARLKDAGSHIGAEQARAEMARPMWAMRDAKPATGKFPVVIYAPSFSANSTENADLCEYLASHGYVVIASPSMGAHTRGMTSDLEGIETQAADIAFLIGYTHTLPFADTSRLAIAGYSWGGISNVFVAARDSRVKALVNLDGSVRYWPEMVAQAKYVRPSRVAIPMLYLAQRPRSLEELAKRDKPAISFLNDMKYSDLYTVTLHPMEHFAFASDSLRFLSPKRFGEYAPVEVSQAYGWMTRYVLQFLNAYLLAQAPAKAFLRNTPTQNGVPAHMLTVVTTLSEGSAPTLEMLAHEASKTGFSNVQEVHAAMRKRDPGFDVSESGLNDWGYKLLASGDKHGAIAIFRMVTSLHPESGNAYDSLAEAYEANQDKLQAIENYQRARQLDPKNENAERHLKALSAP